MSLCVRVPTLSTGSENLEGSVLVFCFFFSVGGLNDTEDEGRQPKQPSWWAARQMKVPAPTRGMLLKAPNYWGITAGRLGSSVTPSWGVSFDTNMQRDMKKSRGLNISEQTYADEFHKAWKLASVVGKLCPPTIHSPLLCTCSREENACERNARGPLFSSLLVYLFVWLVDD